VRLHISAKHVFYKSVALTILELIAFNAQKFRGSRDPSYAPFRKNLRRRSRIRTVPGNMHVKFEVRSFNSFKLV